MTRIDRDRANLDSGTRLHYLTAGSGSPLILIHGFPQTSHQWRHVIPALAAHHLVIAPDYRGAGDSSRPATGYDKHTMAQDVRELAHRLVGPDARPVVVGHDLGAMVAHAYALQFRTEVDRLVVIDAPLPGTQVWDQLTSRPGAWHVNFHGSVDVAAKLVDGNQDWYIEQFIRSRAHNYSLVEQDVPHYVRAYSQPGAIRAAFAAYYAMQTTDRSDNRRAIAEGGRLSLPVLVVGGGESMSGSLLRTMADEVATDVTHVVIAGVGHWIPEEKPEELTAAILAFTQK